MVLNARLSCCTSPVTLVNVPSFSYEEEAGKMTSARVAVSVMNMSWTTTKAFCERKGPNFIGFDPTTQSRSRSGASSI